MIMMNHDDNDENAHNKDADDDGDV